MFTVSPTTNRLLPMKTSQRHSFHQGVASGRGFSLVELLVSIAIGLVVTLAITTVLINSNSSQRTSTSLNDALQTGAFTSLSFDRLARSAGSGFIQAASSFGCLVNSAIAPGPTQILPPATALPAPFERIGDMGAANGVPVRLAPVVIVDGGTDATYGQASDQLIVMAGAHGFSEVRLPAKPNSTTNASTRVESTFGINTNDLVLIASGTRSTGGTGPCMVQQVLNTAGSTVNFGNKYFAAVGATTNLVAFASLPTTAVVPLGAVGALPADPDPNPPQFYVYGVNAARELVRYNLLAPPGPAALETLSENVVSIQAIYATGTSTAFFPLSVSSAFVPDTPAPLAWTTPSGAYAAKGTAGSLLDGSFTSNGLLRGIKGVRVAMVVRSPLAEKTAVAPPSLVMFGDTATPVTYTIPTAESNFRHRIIETVIPLRNL
jgi:type IV pilus assembly protein PilW